MWETMHMGEKDVTEKILESYNDVFADIVNALLFNGKSVIQPEELIDQAPRAAYKADGKVREIERDVTGDLAIVGRFDRMNFKRKAVKALTANIDPKKYIILLDHQPYNLQDAEQSGVDFQLSGHTHHGQIWPVSWITESIYECAFGQHQRGNTNYYVSSGIGLWGGKFRIGTRSEYIVAELRPE